MTNRELKRQIFLEATKRVQAKKAEAYKSNPAKKAYDEGKISWNEYVKRTCQKSQED